MLCVFGLLWASWLVGGLCAGRLFNCVNKLFKTGVDGDVWCVSSLAAFVSLLVVASLF